MANNKDINRDEVTLATLAVNAFVKDMVEKHPNYYSLGEAIQSHYLENIKEDE
tara:strand:+ start:352 stop:510 length:159 start_codon:yes stop_codon:yes gene_type:complete